MKEEEAGDTKAAKEVVAEKEAAGEKDDGSSDKEESALLGEAPDKDEGNEDDPIKTLMDKDKDAGESEQPEESKEQKEAAANQLLEDHRKFEFCTTTKYSDYYQRLIPNKHYRSIRADNARIYGGRFTTKGNLYYCSSQESINLYDTRDPYNWYLKSQIDAQHISWTVTDMDVSPDEQYMIYSSIDPYVRLVDLDTMRKK